VARPPPLPPRLPECMCTVTVHRDDTGFHVTMNRDEARARGPERAPEQHRCENGTHWLGPVDSEKGGTWLGTNEAGLVACLLNRYQDYDIERLPESPESRGHIIPFLLRHATLEQAIGWITGPTFDASAYPPFSLLLLDFDRSMRLDWCGCKSIQPALLPSPWTMETSSFFDTERTLRWRAEAFAAWLEDGARHTHGLPSFHLYQPTGMDNVAPLMSRDVSCTRSITQVVVKHDSQDTVLRYASLDNGKVDWEAFDRPHTIARRMTADT
jgi:hypothetical protein